ncbi:MAG TPA: cupin domain-containing protein [Usitatibacter sp.]|nr:cupin domain-containing protein [Usitatibacter sp.]
MNVTRFSDAPQYFPPNHEGMRCVRLQGHEAGPATTMWLGVSEIAPGGHTDLKGSGVEKHYVVLRGEVTMIAQEPGKPVEEALLRLHDSCRIAPGEARQVVNRGTQTALLLLAMPFA